MSFIENAKTYTGRDLETIFFRPMLTGESAQDLGVRVLYNMPQPTHVQLWDGQRNILQKFTSAGWAGGKAATKYEKTVNLNRVKAELGFSAANYFSMVYEKVSSLVNTHMDDLSGTELEQAETALFKQALAENIRVTMWIGDTSAASGYNTFDGLLKRINGLVDVENKITAKTYAAADLEGRSGRRYLRRRTWTRSRRRADRPETRRTAGTTSSPRISTTSTKYLDSFANTEAAYIGRTEASRYSPTTAFRSSTSTCRPTCAIRPTPKSFCLLTDRRNLVLAVNRTPTSPATKSACGTADLTENDSAPSSWPAAKCSTKLVSFAYKE